MTPPASALAATLPRIATEAASASVPLAVGLDESSAPRSAAVPSGRTPSARFRPFDAPPIGARRHLLQSPGPASPSTPPSALLRPRGAHASRSSTRPISERWVRHDSIHDSHVSRRARVRRVRHGAALARTPSSILDSVRVRQLVASEAPPIRRRWPRTSPRSPIGTRQPPGCTTRWASPRRARTRAATARR